MHTATHWQVLTTFLNKTFLKIQVYTLTILAYVGVFLKRNSSWSLWMLEDTLINCNFLLYMQMCRTCTLNTKKLNAFNVFMKGLWTLMWICCYFRNSFREILLVKNAEDDSATARTTQIHCFKQRNQGLNEVPGPARGAVLSDGPGTIGSLQCWTSLSGDKQTYSCYLCTASGSSDAVGMSKKDF